MSKALRDYLSQIKDKEIIINDDTIIVKKGVVSTKKLLYKVKVKLYMTKKDGEYFTFHNTWNRGQEMPFRVMYGYCLEETKTMIKMNLYADITKSDFCIKCGKPLTNEISKLYGLGPECGQHYYINPLSKDEFEKYKEAIKSKLNSIVWEGWISKSAILSMEVVNE